MHEIWAALIGAIMAGIFQTIIGIIDRRRVAESVLTAIASEVDSICRLIRHQRYLEGVKKVADDVVAGNWDGTSFIIDIRANYFTTYEGSISNIGLLKSDNVSKIVNFYAYCKSAIDSTRPDGPHAKNNGSQWAAMNMVSVYHILTAILSLGDEIVQMPKDGSVYQRDTARKLDQ